VTVPTRAEFTAALLEQDAAERVWQDMLLTGVDPSDDVVELTRRCHDARVALLALIERLPS
jgi:hypothetical protein